MKELNKDNFHSSLKEGLCFVDFWGENCSKCKEYMPGIMELSEKYKDNMNFFKYNVDEDRMFAIKEKVMGLPTIVIYENGTQKTRLAPNKINSLNDIEEFIKENIN